MRRSCPAGGRDGAHPGPFPRDLPERDRAARQRRDPDGSRDVRVGARRFTVRVPRRATRRVHLRWFAPWRSSVQRRSAVPERLMLGNRVRQSWRTAGLLHLRYLRSVGRSRSGLRHARRFLGLWQRRALSGPHGQRPGLRRGCSRRPGDDLRRCRRLVQDRALLLGEDEAMQQPRRRRRAVRSGTELARRVRRPPRLHGGLRQPTGRRALHLRSRLRPGAWLCVRHLCGHHLARTWPAVR